MPNDTKPLELGAPIWFTRLRRIVDVGTSALNVIGTLLIIVIMLLVNGDVIGRGAFNAPISGVPEMVSMSIVAIVFLQIPQTFRMGRVTRSEAILGWLGKRFTSAHAFVEMVFALAAFGLIAVLLHASGPLFVKSWVRGTYEGTIGDFTAPIWPVKLVILIGCTALLIQLALDALGAGFKIRAQKEPRV